MATQENDQMCDNLVQKMTIGKPLDESEKAHLAGCENCMARVVRMLDELAPSESASPISSGGGNHFDLIHARPEAKKALEHGQKVFEREFGISFSKD